MLQLQLQCYAAYFLKSCVCQAASKRYCLQIGSDSSKSAGKVRIPEGTHNYHKHHSTEKMSWPGAHYRPPCVMSRRVRALAEADFCKFDFSWECWDTRPCFFSRSSSTGDNSGSTQQLVRLLSLLARYLPPPSLPTRQELQHSIAPCSSLFNCIITAVCVAFLHWGLG